MSHGCAGDGQAQPDCQGFLALYCMCPVAAQHLVHGKATVVSIHADQTNAWPSAAAIGAPHMCSQGTYGARPSGQSNVMMKASAVGQLEPMPY